MGMLAALIVLLISLPLNTIWRGYVVSTLWNWHAAPLFQLSTLSVSQGISLSLIASVLTHEMFSQKDKEGDSDDEYELLKVSFKPFIMNAVMLFIGWIIHAFQ